MILLRQLAIALFMVACADSSSPSTDGEEALNAPPHEAVGEGEAEQERDGGIGNDDVADAGEGEGAPEEEGPVQWGWERAAPMPGARGEMAAVAVGLSEGGEGTMIVVGGLGGRGGAQNLARVQGYEPAGDRWVELAEMPGSLNHPAAAVVGGRVYVMGGSPLGGNRFTSDKSTALYVYDVAGDSWEIGPSMPRSRWGHAAAAVGGRVYVVAGESDDDARDVTLEFDPVAGGWAERAAIPTWRNHLVAAGHGGKVYAVGGRVGAANLDVCEVYDPAPGVDEWQSCRPMPTPRGGIAGGFLHGRLHVVGGEDLARWAVYDVHETYDPATDSWEVLPPPPTPRHGMPAVALAGGLYVPGGGDQAGLAPVAVNEVWRPRVPAR